MSNKVVKNVRINPITGETDYFFPMEITDPAHKEYANLSGLEVGRAMLGFRTFEAIMIPCKRKTYDAKGREVYLETPSEEQRRIFKAYAKDELDRQEEMKQDGRCPVPGAHGGTKRCPLRIPNPEYTPENGMPKTIPVKCEGCKYEPFKSAHTVVEMSCLDSEDDAGEVSAYEAPAPLSYFAADRYEELAEEFVAFVREHKPKLAPLAEKLVQEYTLTDASKELGKSTSTIFSQRAKLQDLVKEFLATVITL